MSMLESDAAFDRLLPEDLRQQSSEAPDAATLD
jgi:hypothetical protein